MCSLLYELLPLHHLFYKCHSRMFLRRQKQTRTGLLKQACLSVSPDRKRKLLVIARSIHQFISLCKKCNVPERFLSYLNVNIQMASLHVTVYLKFRSSPLLQFVLSHHQVKLISVLVPSVKRVLSLLSHINHVILCYMVAEISSQEWRVPQAT